MQRMPGADELLARADFEKAAFRASSGRCVRCQSKAVDAHHIFERKLFPDGGYRPRNAAALCSECHLLAETCQLSVPEIERLALAPLGWSLLAPPHALALGIDPRRLDKWGNLLRSDGSIAPGPLFDDEGCRKALSLGGRIALVYEAGDFPWASSSR